MPPSPAFAARWSKLIARRLIRPVGARLRAGWKRLGPHGLVRASMLGVLVGMAAIVVLQVWRVDETEAWRREDAAIVAMAETEMRLVLQVGRHAAMLGPGQDDVTARDALVGSLRHSQSQAVALEAGLWSLATAEPDHAGDVLLTQARWQAAREQLWYRAEALANQPSDSAAADRQSRVASVQQAVEPALAAIAGLAEEATRLAHLRTQRAVASLRTWAGLALGLIVLAVFGVAEPTVRAVRRQHRRLAEQAHQHETQRLRTQALLSALPNGVLMRGPDGRGIEANPAAERQLMMSRAQLLGDEPWPPGWRIVHDDMTPMQREQAPAIRALTLRTNVEGATMGVVTAGGELRWMLVNVEVVYDARGELAGCVSCYTDVTEQRNQQALLKHTVDAAGVGTWEWDMRSDRVVSNERMSTMLGWRDGDCGPTMREWVRLIHPEDLPVWESALAIHMADPSAACRAELRIRRPDGEWAAVLSCGQVIEHASDGTPRRMAGIHVDMTEQMQMQAMLRHAARTDGLTQLPNRAAVFDRVQQAITRAGEEADFGYAVLFMDFDRFKQVNDTLGHAVGDELLRQIAHRLRGALRPGDQIRPGAAYYAHTAGRIGGDEFVVVLEGVQGREQACAVARRLMEVLAAPYQIGPHRVHSSASIGIVTSEHPANDAHTVMRDADTAMYEAKRSGRGRYIVFDASMHERVAHGLETENELRLALQRDELFVVYQPVVDLHAGGPASVEALVRWQHPRRGLVPPVEFIPVAEESGLIVELGRHVLATACRQFVAWQRELGSNAPKALAVNLSPAQLKAPSLVADVRQVMAESGIAPHQLQLEVTESLAAQDETARVRLRELKGLGLRVALDDFGTGYSSLACLHQLPVDTVKIDRSFVSHAETSDYHRVLIEATIRVASTLGMDTVAEGIETAGQATLMHSLHCGRGQGYWFAKPLGADDLARWVAARAKAMAAAA